MTTHLSRGLLMFVTDDTRTRLHPQRVAWTTQKQSRTRVYHCTGVKVTREQGDFNDYLAGIIFTSRHRTTTCYTIRCDMSRLLFQVLQNPFLFALVSGCFESSGLAQLF